MVIQKCEKSKKWIFSKNCLKLFVSGREKSAHFRAHYLFWPNTFCLAQTSANQETLLKYWFPRKLPKTKNDTFFSKKVFFLTRVKKWVLLTVFLKNCVFSENTFFIVFSENTAVAKKRYVEKQKIYEKLWVVFEHGKGVFLFVHALMLLWFVFVCLVKLQECLKSLFFLPNCLGFCGGGLFLFTWVWKV